MSLSRAEMIDNNSADDLTLFKMIFNSVLVRLHFRNLTKMKFRSTIASFNS